ncbi:MAG: hypothetical protein ABIJ21_01150 [Nanoarchaeota archaeon]
MDISNKTLALFLVAAIVLSLGGTLISLNRINEITTGPTGYATTGTGMVNLSIVTNTDISIINATVDFGAGVVNVSNGCNYANLSNNFTTGWNAAGCWVNQSFNGAAVRNETSKFVVQNDGNVNVSVTMQSVQKNASNFIGNCTGQNANTYNYTTTINGTETKYACQGALGSLGVWTGLDGTTQSICSELAWEDASDAVEIGLNISICKSNSPKGYRNDNLTFTSAEA